jgi:hypothetical protein
VLLAGFREYCTHTECRSYSSVYASTVQTGDVHKTNVFVYCKPPTHEQLLNFSLKYSTENNTVLSKKLTK